jgi:hypothetical protein
MSVLPELTVFLLKIEQKHGSYARGGGRTLVEKNSVESPFLRKPELGRIHFNKFGLW